MPILIRSASLTHYADVAREAGLDPRRMLAEIGLPPHCLDNPELVVPVDAVRRLLELSAERSGVEGFGLRMAEARRLSNLGPLGLLIREQPTLRRAVESFVAHGPRLNEALFLTVEETEDVVVLREELVVGQRAVVRQSTELAIGVAFRLLKTFLGPDWRPLRVCFAHETPADRSDHQRLFGRNVEFGHDFNGIVCRTSDLDMPNPGADPELARLAQRLVEADDLGAGRGATGALRELILNMLPTGDCSIDRVAQHLGVDRRTVHRRLARESQTFSRLVNAVREELVARYLEDGRRSLAEVSTLLGFSTSSGFSHWYRRRYGASPSRHHALRPVTRRALP